MDGGVYYDLCCSRCVWHGYHHYRYLEVSRMTTETQTPEDWVLLEAATRFTWKFMDMEELRNIHQKPQLFYEHGYRALCDMIQKYEKPPVDRKLACAEQAIAEWVQTTDDVGQEFIATRAIELWDEGFGK
jgi:hypothetical protein